MIRLRVVVVCCVLWLTAAQAGAATLTVAWDPVPDASVAGYVLYWGTQSGAYISSVDVGGQTERQLTALAEGTTYYFVVRAYNAARSLGNPSHEVSASTLSASGPSDCMPGADQNLIGREARCRDPDADREWRHCAREQQLCYRSPARCFLSVRPR